MKTPIISVILPVYNGAPYLKEAVNSILGQTLTDFELIIIDDGSTDDSLSIIKNFTDKRIITLENSSNKGVSYSRNKGQAIAKGKYIAVMDADDIAMPKRFEKQVNYLSQNDTVQAVGSLMEIFGNKHGVTAPLKNENISTSLFFHCQLAHPTMMINADVFKKYKIAYEERFWHHQDWALWVEFIKNGLIINVIPEVLLKYRIAGQNMSFKKMDMHRERTLPLYQKILFILFQDADNSRAEIQYQFVYEKTPDMSNSTIHQHLKNIKQALLIFGQPNKAVDAVIRPLAVNYGFRLADHKPIKAGFFALKSGTFSCALAKYIGGKILKK